MALDNSKLISDVVDRLKKQGLFDKFRKECMADVDTKVRTRKVVIIIITNSIMRFCYSGHMKMRGRYFSKLYR